MMKIVALIPVAAVMFACGGEQTPPAESPEGAAAAEESAPAMEGGEAAPAEGGEAAPSDAAPAGDAAAPAEGREAAPATPPE